MKHILVIMASLSLLVVISPGSTGDMPMGSDMPKRAQSFTNVSIEAGLSGYRGDNLAWGDYNNDGYLDLLVRGPSSNYLFRNEGDGTFADVSDTSGVNITRGYSQWADYDSDGYLDFYTAGDDDHLFRNNGDGTFTDVTLEAGNPSDGLPTEGIAWGDLDRDGYPDIFTVGWRKPGDLQWPYAGERDRLYHNNGDGTFTDISTSAGLRPRSTSYAGMGVVWCDPNEDGWPDIYVSNYHLNPNQLWINDRDGTFTDRAFEYNLTGKATEYQGNTYYGHSNGAGWADFDNDQDMDLWVSHLAHKDDEQSGMNRGYYCADSQLFENSGPPYMDFEDIRVDAGIPITPSGTVVQDPDTMNMMWKDEDYFGVAWGDCDNDGDLDLWIPQVKTYSFWDHSFLWENDGDKTFSDSTDASNLKVWSNTGGTWVDYDNDGDLDFCTEGTFPYKGLRELHLFDNPGTSGHWLELDLKGAGGAHQTSTDATGTKVVLKSGSDTFTRYVGGDCGGHGFQQPQRLHFGLGSRTNIDEMFIHWTSGRIQRFSDVSADQLLTINEPTTQHVDLDAVSFFEVDEDDTVSIDIDISGASITNMYWDMDNDRVFETEVEKEDVDLAYYSEEMRWLRFRVRDSYGTYWDLEPVIVNVTNIPPDMSMLESLVLYEGEVYHMDLSPYDTPSDLENLTIEWQIDDPGNWIIGSSVKDISFEDQGTYTLNARITDDDGEQVQGTTLIEVENRMPHVLLNASDEIIDEDGYVDLEATAVDSEKDLEEMEYCFYSGDGRSTGWIDENTTSFLYQDRGEFRIGVEVRDRHGEIASDSVNITVNNPPPEFYFEVVDNETQEDEEVEFRLLAFDTFSDDGDLQYRMDLDDGYGWSQWQDYMEKEYNLPGSYLKETYMKIIHEFTLSGVHDIRIQVKDDDGDLEEDRLDLIVKNVPPSAEIFAPAEFSIYEDRSFTLTAELSDTSSDVDDLEHKWVFSDGTETEWSGNDPYVDHVFRNIDEWSGTWVRLYIRDDDVEVNLTEYLNVQSMPPVADLSVSSKTVNEDVTVVLDASASTDSASDIDTLEFQWHINNDRIEGGSILRYTFTNSGIYEVEVTVMDNDYLSSVDSVTITVKNLIPTVSLQMIGSAKINEIVEFDASGTFDTPTDMENLVYTFNPGDGSDAIVSSESIVNHSYSEPGSYTIDLTVSDGDDSSTIQGTITILGVQDTAEESKSSALIMMLVIGSFLILLLIGAFGTVLVLKGRAEVPPVTGSQVLPPRGLQIDPVPSSRAGLPQQGSSSTSVAGQVVQGNGRQGQRTPSRPPPAPPMDPQGRV